MEVGRLALMGKLLELSGDMWTVSVVESDPAHGPAEYLYYCSLMSDSAEGAYLVAEFSPESIPGPQLIEHRAKMVMGMHERELRERNAKVVFVFSDW